MHAIKYLPRTGGISCSVLAIFCSSFPPLSTWTYCSVEIHSGGRVPLTMTAITWRRSLFSVFSTQKLHSELVWKPGVINGTTKTTRCECRVKNAPAYVWSLTPAGMSSGKDVKVTSIRLMMSWIRSKWCLHASLACSITAQGRNSVSLLIDVMTSHVTRWRQLFVLIDKKQLSAVAKWIWHTYTFTACVNETITHLPPFMYRIQCRWG